MMNKAVGKIHFGLILSGNRSEDTLYQIVGQPSLAFCPNGVWRGKFVDAISALRLEIIDGMTITVYDQGTFLPILRPHNEQFGGLRPDGILQFIDMQSVQYSYALSFGILFHGIKVSGLPIILEYDPMFVL